MTYYKCLIIDDEPLAQDVLENHLGKAPQLKLIAKCNNAVEAMEIIRSEQPDIIFVDIQMPQVTGLELIRSLQNPPVVIFTTAYAEYAIDGFELSATDYLLKPISLERFLKAVEKAIVVLSVRGKAGENGTEEDYMFVKSDKKMVKINFRDILYIEGLKDYVMIFIPGQRIITLQTMKNLEEYLPADHFLRVHRSFIISVDRIKAVSGNTVEIGDKVIPIGKHYREAFMQLVERFNLIR